MGRGAPVVSLRHRRGTKSDVASFAFIDRELHGSSMRKTCQREMKSAKFSIAPRVSKMTT